MLLQKGENGPFYMTPKECLVKNFSQYDELLLIDHTKAELLGKPKSTGVDVYIVKGKRVVKMQDVSRKNYTSVTKIIRK